MVEREKIPWPQICDGRGPEGTIPQAYRVQGTPLIFVVSPEGILTAKLQRAEKLGLEIEGLLRASARVVAQALRDSWQRPAKLLDVLGIRVGSVVADVGSGAGYFAFHMAERVGSPGKVFAVDIDEKVLAQLRQRAEQNGLMQIETRKGEQADPKLPDSLLDAVLVVDAYHEFEDANAMLRAFWVALKAGGRLGVLDNSDLLGKARTEYRKRHRLPVEILIEEAAQVGFHLVFYEGEFAGPPGETKYYLVVFEKPRVSG
jgi:predicted methyltransferase